MENKFKSNLDVVLLNAYKYWKTYVTETKERIYLTDVVNLAIEKYKEKHSEIVNDEYDILTPKKVPDMYDKMYKHAVDSIINYIYHRL